MLIFIFTFLLHIPVSLASDFLDVFPCSGDGFPPIFIQRYFAHADVEQRPDKAPRSFDKAEPICSFRATMTSRISRYADHLPNGFRSANNALYPRTMTVLNGGKIVG